MGYTGSPPRLLVRTSYVTVLLIYGLIKVIEFCAAFLLPASSQPSSPIAAAAAAAESRPRRPSLGQPWCSPAALVETATDKKQIVTKPLVRRPVKLRVKSWYANSGSTILSNILSFHVTVELSCALTVMWCDLRGGNHAIKPFFDLAVSCYPTSGNSQNKQEEVWFPVLPMLPSPRGIQG